MDITNCTIEIKRHALLRANDRGITPDMVEATLKGGTIESFGKNCLRFRKRYKRFSVICVDRLCGTTITIVTIERS